MKIFYNKKIIVVLFSLLIFVTASKAQSDIDSLMYRKVKTLAYAFAENLFVYRDFTYAAAHTYPPIVQEYGGVERMKDFYKKLFTELDALSNQNVITDIDVAVGIPAKIVEAAQQLQCIVPDTMLITIVGKQNMEKAAGTSPLIGISEDSGNTWYFCFQGDEDFTKRKIDIPTLSDQLVFLPVKNPVIQRGK